MKKLSVVLVIASVLTAGMNGLSYAGDEGWAAAGGLLGGLILGSALSQPSYTYAQPVYYYQPAPVYTYPVVYRRTVVYTPYGCCHRRRYVRYWY